MYIYIYIYTYIYIYIYTQERKGAWSRARLCLVELFSRSGYPFCSMCIYIYIYIHTCIDALYILCIYIYIYVVNTLGKYPTGFRPQGRMMMVRRARPHLHSTSDEYLNTGNYMIHASNVMIRPVLDI